MAKRRESAARKRYLRRQERYLDKLLDYYDGMFVVGRSLPPAEIEEVLIWDAHCVGTRLGTMDWPRWQKYLKEKPRPPMPPITMVKRRSRYPYPGGHMRSFTFAKWVTGDFSDHHVANQNYVRRAVV